MRRLARTTRRFAKKPVSPRWIAWSISALLGYSILAAAVSTLIN